MHAHCEKLENTKKYKENKKSPVTKSPRDKK